MNLFFQKKKKIASSNEKKQPIYMRYHFFVHHEWFLQNLGKKAVRTNMHTTVLPREFNYIFKDFSRQLATFLKPNERHMVWYVSINTVLQFKVKQSKRR